jgi:predicted NACHT family NTPase
MTSEEVKIINDIAKPFVDVIVSTFIKPKIEKLASWIHRGELNSQVSNSNLFENKFQEYLARTYKKCKSLNVLVFPNQQIDIEDIYYPMTICCEKDHTRILVNTFKNEILEPYGKILISDSAGMGKSTLMKFLAVKVIELAQGIPILIDLRNLDESNTIINEILHQLNPIGVLIEKDLILKFIESGNFIFLFDGFDEIQQKNSETIIRDIRQFVDKAGDNRFILTSRPEPSLISFGDFQKFNIQLLQINEAYELIKLYDAVSKFGISDRLIHDIEAKHMQVVSFLANPFLTSLLYKTYSYTKDIPSSKITFYDEVYSALFKNHDLSKDGWRRPKLSNLEIQQFRIILRQLAFDTAKVNLVAYGSQELLQFIKKAKEKSIGIEFSESSFVTDLISSVPLFVEDGLKIKWAHKSFQDFFAAEYLAYDGSKEEKLNQIYLLKKASYLNILDLFYEIDYKTFRRTILKKLLDDFDDYSKVSFCNFPEIPDDDIEERKAYMVFNKNVMYTMKTFGDIDPVGKRLEKFYQITGNLTF